MTMEEFKSLQNACCKLLGIEENSLSDPDFLKRKFAEDYKVIQDAGEKDENARKLTEMLNKFAEAMTSPDAMQEIFSSEESFDRYELEDYLVHFAQDHFADVSSIQENALLNIYTIGHFAARIEEELPSAEDDGYFDDYKIGEIEEEEAAPKGDIKDFIVAGHLLRSAAQFNEHLRINAVNQGYGTEVDQLLIKIPTVKADPSDKEAYANEVFSYVFNEGSKSSMGKLFRDAQRNAEELGIGDGLDDPYYDVDEDMLLGDERPAPPQLPKLNSPEEIKEKEALRNKEKQEFLERRTNNLSAIIKQYNSSVRIQAANALMKEEDAERFLVRIPGVSAAEGSTEFEEQISEFTRNHKDNKEIFAALKAAQKEADDYRAQTGIDFCPDRENGFYKAENFRDDLCNEYLLPELPRRLTEEELEQKKQELAENAESFKTISSKASTLDSVHQGLKSYATEYELPEDPNDEYRFTDKKTIKGMSEIYRAWFPNDKEIAPILDMMDQLSRMDVTAYEGYTDEGSLMTKLSQKTSALAQSLAKEEANIHQEAVGLFRKEVPTGSKKFYWAQQDSRTGNYYWEIGNQRIDAGDERSRQMTQKDEELKRKVSDIDRKNAIVISLNKFIDSRRSGDLAVDPNAEIIEASTEEFETIFRNTDSARGPLDLSTKKTTIADYKDMPLFPHQPCEDDVRQGGIGDCYFVGTLSGIARLHPEKIRENMIENDDGTVTVRLFRKLENEPGDTERKYEPVFVKVDKKIPMTQTGTTMSKNSIWVTCYEKALATSGLYNGKLITKPLPNNPKETLDKKYNELKKLEKEGKLNGALRAEMQEEYPWLFKTIQDHSKGLPKEINVLVKWPSLNSIVGGHGYDATEIILGPAVKMNTIHAVDAEYGTKGGFIKETPKTPQQVSALVLANMGNSLTVPFYGMDPGPEKSLDLTLPPDELFEAAFKLSKLPPEKKEQAKAEFEDNQKRINNALKKSGKEAKDLSKDEFLELSEDALRDHQGNSSSSRYNYYSTFRSMGRDRYTKAQEKLYQDIDNCLKHRLPVGMSTLPPGEIKLPLPSPHQFSIQGVYTDDLGNKMIKIRNPWGTSSNSGVKLTINDDGSRSYSPCDCKNGEFEMEFGDFLSNTYDLEMGDVKEYLKNDPKNPEMQKESEKPEMQKKSEGPKEMNLDKAKLSYIGALNEVCNTFAKTEHWYRSSSDEYIKLRNAAKAIRQDLLSMEGGDAKDFKEKFNSLSEAIDSYEEHCRKNPPKWDKARRNTRLTATQNLKLMIEAAKAESESPVEFAKNHYKTKQIPDNIKKLNQGIQQAASENNAEKLIDCLAGNAYLNTVQANMDKLPAQKVGDMIRPEKIKENVEKRRPLFAKVLAAMSVKDINKAVQDGTIYDRLNKDISEKFKFPKDVSNAAKEYKGNVQTLNTNLGKEKQAQKSSLLK